jgi:hypothetical protein
MERPNHRLAALLKGSFSDVVLGEQAQAKQTYGSELWWQPVGEVLLSPDSMDGAAASAFSMLMRRLIDQADDIIRSAGGTAVAWDAHHDDLRALLVEARQLAPAGLARIGALVESPGGELLHGGPLDGQILEAGTPCWSRSGWHRKVADGQWGCSLAERKPAAGDRHAPGRQPVRSPPRAVGN